MTNQRAIAPVIWWAALGAIFLVTQIYVYGAWITSPDFRPTGLGPDPVPRASQIAMRVYEAISLIILPIMLVWFWRGIAKTGHVDNVRLLMIGWLSAYWLDPWLNFLTPMFTYNAYAVNMGCWCEFIPGWQAPNGSRYAEPLLIDAPAYFSTFTFTALTSLGFINWARARRPTSGTVTLALAGFVGVWLTMGVLDIVATRYLHFDGWPGSFQSVSFWGGKFYQFPIYEFILFPTPFVVCAFLLMHVNADKETIIERGAGAITGARWKRTAARALAFIAFCNLLNLAYTSAMAVHAVYADPWPEDFPSWLANGQCGGKTGIPCPAR